MNSAEVIITKVSTSEIEVATPEISKKFPLNDQGELSSEANLRAFARTILLSQEILIRFLQRNEQVQQGRDYFTLKENDDLTRFFNGLSAADLLPPEITPSSSRAELDKYVPRKIEDLVNQALQHILRSLQTQPVFKFNRLNLQKVLAKAHQS